LLALVCLCDGQCLLAGVMFGICFFSTENHDFQGYIILQSLFVNFKFYFVISACERVRLEYLCSLLIIIISVYFSSCFRVFAFVSMCVRVYYYVLLQSDSK